MLLLEVKWEDEDFVDLVLLVFKYDVWECNLYVIMDNYVIIFIWEKLKKRKIDFDFEVSDLFL